MLTVVLMFPRSSEQNHLALSFFPFFLFFSFQYNNVMYWCLSIFHVGKWDVGIYSVSGSFL